MGDLIKPSQNTKQTHPMLPDGSTSEAYFTEKPQVHMLQIPRDYVLKVPSEDNQNRYKSYTTYKPLQRRIRRNCCRCFCASVCLIVLIVIVLGCCFYFLFQPKAPSYTLSDLSISGFEPLLNSSVTPLNPSIFVTVRTENPNKKISILYQNSGSVSVSFDQLHLCKGVWPAFRQRPKNVTVFETNLTGSGVLLTASNRDELVKDVQNGSVPLKIYLKVPVKIKFSLFTSWVIRVKVSCDVSVTSLTAQAAVLSDKCHIKI